MSLMSDPVKTEEQTNGIAEAREYSAELPEQLNLIISSPALKRSQRRRFVKYVVERALRSEHEDLKERTIGIDLFQKPAAYDTGWTLSYTLLPATCASVCCSTGAPRSLQTFGLRRIHVRE